MYGSCLNNYLDKPAVHLNTDWLLGIFKEFLVILLGVTVVEK